MLGLGWLEMMDDDGLRWLLDQRPNERNEMSETRNEVEHQNSPRVPTLAHRGDAGRNEPCETSEACNYGDEEVDNR